MSKQKLTTFDDLWEQSSLTPEEKEEIMLKVELVGKIIEAREEKGLTQQALADICGIKQPVIARLESHKSDPQLNTILKILRPLGYKLAIVPDVSAGKKLIKKN
jgi:DNA-binding XRE family transcriptional regulator